ncbi:dolichol kinase [Chelonus insularis]|uniref:dolichol kinase n=1 Tax=Chelonus insularis TaxID=460826 RepID=UPI001588590D|nr:dolichol kinase [Chelonus insularis]
MELITTYNIEKKIFKNFERNGIIPRRQASTGLWLGLLIGLCAITTLLREDHSYSEICLLVGVTGISLIISCFCLFIQLSRNTTASRDFQVLYFLPASISSMLYLLWVNKGLFVSVIWGLGVGSLSTWGVLQIMSHLPGCFTLGESITVMHGIILFLLSCGTNLPLRYHLPPLHDDDIATTILQVGILFVGLVCFLCLFYPKVRTTNYFYLITFGLLTFGVIPLLHVLLDQSPLLWMIFFAFGNIKRVFLIIYWAICSLITVTFITYKIFSDSNATTVDRKALHFLAALVYLPGLILEPTLLYLASGIVLALFIFLELMRLIKVPPLNSALEYGFSVFVDDKDCSIALTPLYLHAGLSFPLWMPTSNIELLPLLSGVLSLGIGDATASIVGTLWGKHKWSGTNKSIEGTIGCILSQLVVIYGLAILGFVSNGWFTLLKSTLAVIGVSLVEAQTNQIDNLVLPLLLYIFLLI